MGKSGQQQGLSNMRLLPRLIFKMDSAFSAEVLKAERELAHAQPKKALSRTRYE